MQEYVIHGQMFANDPTNGKIKHRIAKLHHNKCYIAWAPDQVRLG
jgi:hypothetical protein